MIRAVIFDMDGVLADTTAINQLSYQGVLGRYGIVITDEAAKRYRGRSLKEQFLMWQEEYGVVFDESFEEFRRVVNESQLSLFSKALMPNVPFLEYLASLKGEGVKIAVGTSSSKGRAESILKMVGVWPLLDAFVGAEDVVHHKPAPDLFLAAAKAVGVPPRECVVVEDALNGIQAARAAGCQAVALVTQQHTADDFSHADAVISGLGELPGVFASLSSLEK